MTSWDFCQIMTRKGGHSNLSGSRLGGPWLRYKLFTATAPDNTTHLWVSDHKDGLTGLLPNVSAKDAKKPPDLTLIPLEEYRRRQREAAASGGAGTGGAGSSGAGPSGAGGVGTGGAGA